MIRFRGNKVIVTGKDEKWLKKEAKKIGVSPEKLFLDILKELARRVTVIEKDITLEQI